MKLTTRGRYALQAIMDLVTNSHGKAIKLEDISSRQKISLHYLEQLFRKLRIVGVVKSVRGPGGGYVLGREPSNITVKEILLGVDEQVTYVDLVRASLESTSEQKSLVNYLESLEAVVQVALNKTLSEVIKNEPTIAS